MKNKITISSDRENKEMQLLSSENVYKGETKNFLILIKDSPRNPQLAPHLTVELQTLPLEQERDSDPH